MLLGCCSEPDPDGPLGPGECLGVHQLLDAFLPEDPDVHPVWDSWGGDTDLPQLFWLQAARLTLDEARAFRRCV